MADHGYNKILKFNWLSTILMSALTWQVLGQYISCLLVIGQYVPLHKHLNGFVFSLLQKKTKKTLEYLVFWFLKSLKYHKFSYSYD